MAQRRGRQESKPCSHAEQVRKLQDHLDLLTVERQADKRELHKLRELVHKLSRGERAA